MSNPINPPDDKAKNPPTEGSKKSKGSKKKPEKGTFKTRAQKHAHAKRIKAAAPRLKPH